MCVSSFNAQTPLNLVACNGSVPILEIRMTLDNSNLQGHVMGSHRGMGTNDRAVGNKTIAFKSGLVLRKSKT